MWTWTCAIIGSRIRGLFYLVRLILKINAVRFPTTGATSSASQSSETLSGWLIWLLFEKGKGKKTLNHEPNPSCDSDAMLAAAGDDRRG